MSELDIKIKTAIRVLKMAEKQADLSGEPLKSHIVEAKIATFFCNLQKNAKQFLENYFNTNL